MVSPSLESKSQYHHPSHSHRSFPRPTSTGGPSTFILITLEASQIFFKTRFAKITKLLVILQTKQVVSSLPFDHSPSQMRGVYPLADFYVSIEYWERGSSFLLLRTAFKITRVIYIVKQIYQWFARNFMFKRIQL
jgi:hypothetical protein